MYKYLVLGIAESQFTTKDGKVIHGYNVYVGSEDAKCDGMRTDRLFVVDRKFINGVRPKSNDMIEVYYNRFGKVDSVAVCA